MSGRPSSQELAGRHRSEADYIDRTIATVRNHRGADNCWPQWANIFADEIEDLRADRDALAARLQATEQALREIAQQQPKTIDWLRANGIVFDGPLGTDPDNWEHVAFGIYNDLCETDSIARRALGGAAE